MKNDKSEIVRSFKGLVDLSVNHFESIYKEPEGNKIT
jgi:hypothetical protein